MKNPRQPAKIDRPERDRLPALIESLLFVADEPQEIGTLARSLNATRQGVERAVEELIAENGRGLFVQRLGDRVQLATVPDAAPYIEHFLEVDHGRLSRAALETLAIIAYRQPLTRAAIEAVRGVNSDHAVATLAGRALIEDQGRSASPGRPVLFGTTVRFLEYFGLQRPEDMPRLPELEAEPAGDGVAVEAAGGESEADEPAAALEDSSPEQAEPEAERAEDGVTGESEADQPAAALENSSAEETELETDEVSAAKHDEAEIPAEFVKDEELDAVKADGSEPAVALEDSAGELPERDANEAGVAPLQTAEAENATG